MFSKCPGADKFRQPQPTVTSCLFCGEEVEIWTDELQSRCPNCKSIVERQIEPNCLDWCRYAKESVGEQVYNKYLKNKKKTP